MNALPNIRQKTCGIFFRQSLVVRIAGYYICGRFCSEGRIAQPVQSICLTSRGSEVRILLRPQSHLVFQGGFFFFIAIPQGGSAHPDLHREGRRFESFCAHKATSIFRVAFSFIAMPQGGSAHPDLHREGRSFESFCAHKATSIFRVAFSFLSPYLKVVQRIPIYIGRVGASNPSAPT